MTALLAPLACGLGAAVVTPAYAQAYPSRPIKMVVAYPPAGATDTLARLIGQKLGSHVGQPIVIDNRPGAGSTIGMDIAARTAPDGYNMFLSAVTTQAIASYLYPNTQSDLRRDFVPVSLIASAPHMLIVNNEVPVKSMGEFVAWIKAQKGGVNYASQGTGTLSHLESELMCQHLGVQAMHVPYKGSSLAITDLLSGNVSFMFDSVASSMSLVRSGKVRGLAVASSRTVPALPELPTVANSGIPGYDVDNWFGIYMPKGTPTTIVSALAKATADILQDPGTVDGLVQKGYLVTPGDGARLAALAAEDYARWGKVIKAAKVTV